MDRWVQTASVLHSNGDALDIAVKDGRIIGVRGRGVDRVNKGRVDPKDLFGWQANNSEDRLKKPLVRDENGDLVEASRDEAFARIIGESERLLSTVLQGFYQSHQATAASCQVNNIHLIRGVIGRPGCGVLHLSTVRTDNAPKVRFSATVGEVPEVELALS